MKRNIVGHNFEKGGSDKVYICGIRENSPTEFVVIAKWGRRGSNMNMQEKGKFSTLACAEAFMVKLWSSKASTGYLDIESSLYAASNIPVKVSITDTSIMKNLENEGMNETKQDKNGNILDNSPFSTPVKPMKEAVKQFEMVCVDNVGMEDKFDCGIEYVVEDHPLKDMLYAYDKHGNRGEFFKTRFEKAK
jgi:predicted DNA-binding WGR domain protein